MDKTVKRKPRMGPTEKRAAVLAIGRLIEAAGRSDFDLDNLLAWLQLPPVPRKKKAPPPLLGLDPPPAPEPTPEPQPLVLEVLPGGPVTGTQLVIPFAAALDSAEVQDEIMACVDTLSFPGAIASAEPNHLEAPAEQLEFLPPPPALAPEPEPTTKPDEHPPPAAVAPVTKLEGGILI